MPATQGISQCGCCFEWIRQSSRKLTCGHPICLECYDEQAEKFKERYAGNANLKPKLTCVMQNYEDWYNIDVIPEPRPPRSVSVVAVSDSPSCRSLTPAVSEDGGYRTMDGESVCSDTFVLPDDEGHMKFGCRKCQIRIFNVKNPEIVKVMPILKDINIVEDASRRQQCETDTAHDSVTPDATFWCMGCDKYICRDCRRYHRIIRTLDSEHNGCKLFSLAQKAGEEEIGPNMYLQRLKNFSGCARHNGMEQTLFCLRCKRLVCKLCLQDSNSHAGHLVEELHHAVEEIKAQTKLDMDKLTNLFNTIEEKKSGLSAKKEEKEDQFRKMKSDVEKYADELYKKVEEAKQSIWKDIEDERQLCLAEIEDHEKSLEEAGVEVWTFGEATHRILDAGSECTDLELNQTVLVQKHLASNREAFDAIRVPVEGISLKRTLNESCTFKQNVAALDRIVPGTLGHATRECRETFLVHEHRMNQSGQQNRHDRGRPVEKCPQIAVTGSHIALSDMPSGMVKVLRVRSDLVQYQDSGVTIPVSRPTSLASLGHGFILACCSNHKLTLSTTMGGFIPIPQNLGPNNKYEICSLACVGKTLYFGCYERNTSAGRAVICYQDFEYDISPSSGQNPFRFSVCLEYGRISDSVRPHCLAVRKGSNGPEMAIGQPREIIFFAKKMSVTNSLAGGNSLRVMGLCFDRDGDVLVADGIHILLFGIDGALKGIVVGPEEGLKRPVSLAVSDSNDLIVVDEELGLRTFIYGKTALRRMEFRYKV